MRIDLERVGKRYGQVAALAGVSLAVPSGARVALIGPNGSGKTTLTRAIMGVIAHDGEVRLDGVPAAVQSAVRAGRLAYVPQIAPQLASSVGELVGSIARLRALPLDRIEEIMVALELDPRALWPRAFRGLSGGMKQKLLLSLALASRASLFVLDEPTASLDARARVRFYELYERHAAGATLLLCSHRLEEIRHMVEEVIVLDEGRVTYHGPAQAYLDARTRTVLELELERSSLRAADWARSHGFAPAAPGWWSQAVTSGQKLPLLSAALAELGAQVRNVCVRDLETVAPGAEVVADGEDKEKTHAA
jgi:ABC-2 type transport system ATP-binding protein